MRPSQGDGETVGIAQVEARNALLLELKGAEANPRCFDSLALVRRNHQRRHLNHLAVASRSLARHLNFDRSGPTNAITCRLRTHTEFGRGEPAERGLSLWLDILIRDHNLPNRSTKALGAAARLSLVAGERCAVPPKTAHYVHGEADGVPDRAGCRSVRLPGGGRVS